MYSSETTNQCITVSLFEFMETATVHNSRYYFSHIIWRSIIIDATCDSLAVRIDPAIKRTGATTTAPTAAPAAALVAAIDPVITAIPVATPAT